MCPCIVHQSLVWATVHVFSVHPPLVSPYVCAYVQTSSYTTAPRPHYIPHSFIALLAQVTLNMLSLFHTFTWLGEGCEEDAHYLRVWQQGRECHRYRGLELVRQQAHHGRRVSWLAPAAATGMQLVEGDSCRQQMGILLHHLRQEVK